MNIEIIKYIKSLKPKEGKSARRGFKKKTLETLVVLFNFFVSKPKTLLYQGRYYLSLVVANPHLAIPCLSFNYGRPLPKYKRVSGFGIFKIKSPLGREVRKNIAAFRGLIYEKILSIFPFFLDCDKIITQILTLSRNKLEVHNG